MRIIGHRGAAGLALENSIQSIKAAKQAGVDAVEFDIRLTADNHFVLAHDSTTARISGIRRRILKSKLRELRLSPLHNNEPLPTLAQALQACGATPVVLEPKGSDWAEHLAKEVRSDTKQKYSISVIAFDHGELAAFRALCPATPTYALEHTSPFDALHAARLHNFSGIDINFWLLNPLTYYLARRARLDVFVYTVNSPLLARLLNALYPSIAITTNRPDKLQFLRN